MAKNVKRSTKLWLARDMDREYRLFCGGKPQFIESWGFFLKERAGDRVCSLARTPAEERRFIPPELRLNPGEGPVAVKIVGEE
jgi:hypothetical protein